MKREKRSSQGAGVAGRDSLGKLLLRIASVGLVVFLCLYYVGLPFFLDTKYDGIAVSKTAFYRSIALYLRTAGGGRIPSLLFWTSLLALFGLALTRSGPSPAAWFRQKRKGLDLCVLLYEASVVLSYLCSPYQKEALLGFYGWNMGLYTQLSMGALYFLCSRLLDQKQRRAILCIALGAASVVFVTGVLQRFRIDVYGYYELILGSVPRNYSRILGPIGHVDFAGSYMMLMLPAGMCALLFGRNRRIRMAGLAFLGPGFTFAAVMGAESIWPAMGVLFCFLMAVSLRDALCFRRWLLMLLWFFLMLLAMALLRQYLPAEHVMQLKGVTRRLLVLRRVAAAAAVAAVGMLLYERLVMGTARRDVLLARIRISLPGVASAAAILLLAYVILNSLELLPDSLSRRNGPLFFEPVWGTGRGGVWICTIRGWLDMIRRQPLRLFAGSGPDTYYSAVYLPQKEAFTALFGRNVIYPTAMSEPLTVLCNLGFPGFAAFLGLPMILVSRLRQTTGHSVEKYYYPAAVLAYYIFGLLNFHGVTSTPGMFILCGMSQAWFLEQAPMRDDGDLTDPGMHNQRRKVKL